MEGCVKPRGRMRSPSKTAGGPGSFEELGPLKIGLRRWWDPNQEFPGEGRTARVRRRTRRVGRSDGALALCDASDREDRMALKLEEKKVVVAEVNAVAAKALSVVGAENRGLTVTQMTALRAKARKEGVYLRIVKNTLARKAVAGTAFECISS